MEVCLDRDGPLLAELHCICQEIEQHLLQSSFVKLKVREVLELSHEAFDFDILALQCMPD